MFGDGKNLRDYIHVHDVADAVHAVASLPNRPGIVNVGTGVGNSILDVVGLVEQITGKSLPVKFAPDRSCDVRANVLDVTLLRTLTGCTPRPLAIGLRNTWRSMDADQSVEIDLRKEAVG